ncbi:type III-B CRISPR module RAMP protein Cmr1 [Anoxybacter fermentans]|uniref:Type III-B CRISPR module RAMP protein Cmr1 n=1 Tax=Anoxybacter fermentans TaxID=1323375 RepID=A0A3Q9HND9_9FIRM|nr:type III-B CRISPR module RAMP protein Cmr1 [Anoxybacter fermentans]AZR71955.1 type III-B CRISPR module RAMP protein Cmr1 [Anoxybacter fermentans]
MKDYTVKIKPLTPLWTGDANRRGNAVRETGIIGSLRWWYEALVKGLGGTSCDPTDIKCNGENHCDVCELFGCTGWARKFRLEVSLEGENPSWEFLDGKIGTRRKHNKVKKFLVRNFSGFVTKGLIVITFIPLRKIELSEWELLNRTLNIIEDYGALGARTSQGNGVIKIVENNLPVKQNKIDLVTKGKSVDQPILKDFFFYKFRIKFADTIENLIKLKVFWTHAPLHNSFKENWEQWERAWHTYEFLPIAFHVRDAIRPLIKDKAERHKVFGECGKGSRVFVSHGYKIDEKKVEVRIFGYGVNEEIKKKIKNNFNRQLKEKLFQENECIQKLKDCSLQKEKTGKEIIQELKNELEVVLDDGT